jgi:diguanylate cyclase (GGDEF)-like protein
MALLYIDIDGLKTINDELGHREGDRALIDFADILKNAFRESDIIARIGGDEFVVFLTEPYGPDIEKVVVKHLRDRLDDFNVQSGREYELILSIGMAIYDQEHLCSIEELLRISDSRMFKDKKNHKLQNPRTPIRKNR